MKFNRLITASALSLMTLAGTVSAQNARTQSPMPLPLREVIQLPAQTSTRWVVAKRQVLAVTYRENKQTTVMMAGTALAPSVMGKADVEYKQGRTNVRLEMKRFENPQTLGGFYTTYVLWAVAPEGQAESLMELPIQKDFKIESTTKFQTFGLMITAEPHGRVELPSPMIVAENSLRDDTRGQITSSRVEYSGDPGTFYLLFDPTTPSGTADYTTPLLILGARRSVEIAQRADAKQFAATELREAELKLATLEQAWPRSRKPSDLRDNAKKNSGLAHDVMRMGEHARKLSVERSEQARLDTERQQADANLAQANSDTNRARNEADRARNEASRATNDAGLARLEADRARTDAENARAAERAQIARADGEIAAARMRVEQAQSETDKAKANAELAKAEADRARTAEQAQIARADSETAEARIRVAQAQSETDKAQAVADLARAETARALLQTAEANRERDAAQQNLFVSLSAILATRRETRGLIVNLSDVLFDTGQTTLKAGAREKLSKLSGILLAYSGAYQLEIEGHTDSVGTEDSNLALSRGRAESVRDYLTQNGIQAERFTAARGFGEAKPVAENDSATGRQINRRVEIIISDKPPVQAKAVNQ